MSKAEVDERMIEQDYQTIRRFLQAMTGIAKLGDACERAMTLRSTLATRERDAAALLERATKKLEDARQAEADAKARIDAAQASAEAARKQRAEVETRQATEHARQLNAKHVTFTAAMADLDAQLAAKRRELEQVIGELTAARRARSELVASLSS